MNQLQWVFEAREVTLSRKRQKMTCVILCIVIIMTVHDLSRIEVVLAFWHFSLKELPRQCLVGGTTFLSTFADPQNRIVIVLGVGIH